MRAAWVVLGLAVGACSRPADVAPAEAPAGPLESVRVPTVWADTLDGTTTQAATDLVLLYYGALAAGEHRHAYEMWGPDGPPGQSFDQFRSAVPPTNVIVEEPSEPRGAAGSVFVTVPVRLTTRGGDGQEQTSQSDIVVRRLNGVSGAEPWQLRWHIDQIEQRGPP